MLCKHAAEAGTLKLKRATDRAAAARSRIHDVDLTGLATTCPERYVVLKPSIRAASSLAA